MQRRVTTVALGLLVACGGRDEASGLARDTGVPPDAHSTLARPVAIDAEGYFVLEGRRTAVFGVEEEHHRYTWEELDALIPALKEAGVSFLVLYVGNPQEDFFYQRLEAEGLWVAQDLGNVKKQTLSPFANTGGVIGDVPDPVTVEQNLAQIGRTVGRLSRFRNILFWWMGGEFAEPGFHQGDGPRITRDSIRRYAEAVRALDPLDRPFTVSHHYVEALEGVALPFLDLSDLTDFTWFTVATHFHRGDFLAGAGWEPVASTTEHPLVLRTLLERAWELNHRRPLFLGGWYGQAPEAGACAATDQQLNLTAKWELVSRVPHSGGSTWHLSSWGENANPHSLFEWDGARLRRTAAGDALREIASEASGR